MPRYTNALFANLRAAGQQGAAPVAPADVAKALLANPGPLPAMVAADGKLQAAVADTPELHKAVAERAELQEAVAKSTVLQSGLAANQDLQNKIAEKLKVALVAKIDPKAVAAALSKEQLKAISESGNVSQPSAR